MVDTPEVIKYVVPKEYQPNHPVVEKKEGVVEGLVLYPDPILQQVAIPVEDPWADEYDPIIKLMSDILKETRGIGLAAPQIGVSKRIILVQTEQAPIVMFNPEIVDRTGVHIDNEACLSLPRLEVSVARSKQVTVRGLDLAGRKEIEVTTSSTLTAACFQHEIDHLNGVLLLNYASRQQRRAYERSINKRQPK